jgi:hypothetical protein
MTRIGRILRGDQFIDAIPGPTPLKWRRPAPKLSVISGRLPLAFSAATKETK